MPLRMIVDGKAAGDSVFEVDMDPSDVRRLGAERSAQGDVSVIVVGQPQEPLGGSLEFDLGSARVLQVGDSRKAFFIMEKPPSSGTRDNGLQPSPEQSAAMELPSKYIGVSSGEGQFISRLPIQLRATGEKLIHEMRRVYPGRLVYYEKSQRYVESPDNFWTVKIQPRVGDLEITVRGNHGEFSVPQGLTLKPDRTGYSRFKISRPEHVDAALRILSQAKKRV